MGTPVDRLLQQNGIGEMRLLAPALRTVAERRVVLLRPPHAPQVLALAALDLRLNRCCGPRRAHGRRAVGGRAGAAQR